MAAGNTYVSIATQTLGSTATSITFSSIAGTYTDLVIVADAGDATPAFLKLQFNGDTGANYSNTVLRGDGAAAGSQRHSGNTFIYCDVYANLQGTLGQAPHRIQIMNYANTTTNKTCLIRADNAGLGTEVIVGLWRSTAAITSVTLFVTGGTFMVGSTFTLYGILAA